MTTISVEHLDPDTDFCTPTDNPNKSTSTIEADSKDREFLVIIALLMAIAVLAINMILPAFDQITGHFILRDDVEVGLSVSLLYFGLSLGQIVFGPVSDSIGRKGALSIGLGLFLIGCAISGTANAFEVLLLGQIFQGFGLGAPRILTLAILRDRFSGAAMASAMSFVMVMFVLAPTFGPFFGQIIVNAGTWRSLFFAFAGMGGCLIVLIWLRLPETLSSNQRRTMSLRASYLSYLEVSKSPQAVGYSVALGVISGPFIAYLNRSQQIFEFHYELGTLYPIVFALLSLWIGAASLLNSKIVHKIGLGYLVLFAMLGIITTSVIATAMFVLIGSNLPIFIVYIGIILFSFGLLVSNLNALAMAELADIAGTGAAFVGALSTFISIPIAILIGRFGSGTGLSIIMGFLICGVFALSIHLVVSRRIWS
jgi:DHA1 family bicyclomycin/chloramphenicol resistance-like MFS transporter